MQRINQILTILILFIFASAGWFLIVQTILLRQGITPTKISPPDFLKVGALQDYEPVPTPPPLLELDPERTDRGGEGDTISLKLTSNIPQGHKFAGGETFTVRILASPKYRGQPNNMLHLESIRFPIRYNNTYLKLKTLPSGTGVKLDDTDLSEDCNFYETAEPSVFIIQNIDSFNSFYYHRKFPRGNPRYNDLTKGIQLQPNTCIGEIKFQVIRKEQIDPTQLTSPFINAKVMIPNVAREIGLDGRGPEGTNPDGTLIGNIDLNEHYEWKISNGQVVGTFALGNHLKPPQGVNPTSNVPTDTIAPTVPPGTGTPASGGNFTWTQVNNTAGTSWDKVKFVNQSIGYVGGGGAWITNENYPAKIAKTTDGGLTWTVANISNLIGWVQGLDCKDANNCVITKDGPERGVVMETRNGGTSWQDVVRNDGWPAWLWGTGYTGIGDTVVVGTTGDCGATASDCGPDRQMSFIRAEQRNSNGKLVFERVAQFPNAGEYMPQDLSCPSPGICYAAASGRAYKTTDNGITWRSLGTGATGSGDGARYTGIDCTSNDKCWEVGMSWGDGTLNTRIIRSTNDGGASWNNSTFPNLPGRPLVSAVDMITATNGYAVGCTNIHTDPESQLETCIGTALFFETNNGTTWNQMTAPPTNATLTDLHVIDANTIVVSDYGGKIWRGTRSGGNTLPTPTPTQPSGGHNSPTPTPTNIPGGDNSPTPTATTPPGNSTPTNTPTNVPPSGCGAYPPTDLAASFTPGGFGGTFSLTWAWPHTEVQVNEFKVFDTFEGTQAIVGWGLGGSARSYSYSCATGYHGIEVRAYNGNNCLGKAVVQNVLCASSTTTPTNTLTPTRTPTITPTPTLPYLCLGLTIPSVECEALVSLYNSTNQNGHTWLNHTNWLIRSDPCVWYGVSCEFVGDTQHVIELNLYANGLSGTIPRSVRKLPYLRALYISGNPLLTGSIPEQIGELTQLRTLDLHGNSLSGTIPQSIGSMIYLENLYLNNNQLSGPFPDELGYLMYLEALTLNNNNFAGPVPLLFTNFEDYIQHITLGHNRFTGVADTVICPVLTHAEQNPGWWTTQSPAIANPCIGTRSVSAQTENTPTPMPYYIDMPPQNAQWPLLWVDQVGVLTYSIPIDYDLPQVDDTNPDLTVVSMELYSDPSVATCTIELQTKIKNTGQTAATPFSVMANSQTYRVLTGLAPGQEMTLRFSDYRHGTMMDPNGVRVDSNDEVSEIREDNNILERFLFLGSITRPECQNITPPGATGGPPPGTGTPGGITDVPLDMTKVNIKVKVRLQGVRSDTFSQQYSHIKFGLAVGAVGKENTDYMKSDFLYKGSGTYEGIVTFDPAKVPQGNTYKLLVKGPKHLAKRFCNSQAQGDDYFCAENAGAIRLTTGLQTFDFSTVNLAPGDLPLDGQQDGVVDSSDLSFIRQNLGNKSAEQLRIGDINLDGIIDTQDFSLVINNLINNEDER